MAHIKEPTGTGEAIYHEVSRTIIEVVNLVGFTLSGELFLAMLNKVTGFA